MSSFLLWRFYKIPMKSQDQDFDSIKFSFFLYVLTLCIGFILKILWTLFYSVI